MSRLLLLAAVAWVGACAADQPIAEPIAYDPCRSLAVAPTGDLSALQRAAIDDAVAMWRAVLPHASRADGDAVPLSFEDAAPFFHGIYLPEDGAIVINARLTDRHGLAVTVAHELGHAFGLPHDPSHPDASVMAPGNLVVEPTSRDVLEIERLWGSCETPSPASIALP